MMMATTGVILTTTPTTTRVSVLMMLMMMLLMMVGAAELSQRPESRAGLSFESSQRSDRTRRGFRLGAADRFSHGFGKRLSQEEERNPPNSISGFPIKNDELVRLLTKNPAALLALVEKYIDTNRDGVVTKSELLGGDMQSPK